MLNLQILRGVLFRSNIRGGHASLAIAIKSESEKVVLVVIRFGGSEWSSEETTKNDEEFQLGKASGSERSDMKYRQTVARMRSNVRRFCKIGNELEFVGYFETAPEPLSTPSAAENSSFVNLDRFVVDYHIDEDKCENLRLIQGQKWDATRCQMLQKEYFPVQMAKQQKKSKRSASNDLTVNNSASIHHKSGLGKRQMGEVVADFLLHIISTLYGVHGCPEHNDSPKLCADLISDQDNKDAVVNKRLNDYQFKDRIVPHTSVCEQKAVVKLLEKMTIGANRRKHSGYILDVAGGAGHVSLALALRNVKSTVIDPRSTVGNLPGRDRKALKKSQKDPFFGVYRAWFGARPDGVDTFFREGCKDYFAKTSGPRSLDSIFEPGDGEGIPVCTIDSQDKLIANCSAIVALHPDEATGVIVETAVMYRIPFVVV